MTRTHSYKVNLVGITWAGYKSAYSYTFDHLPTTAEIRRGTGDFQHVIDYEMIETVREGNWDREVITHKVIDTWQHEDSEDVYLECAQ